MVKGVAIAALGSGYDCAYLDCVGRAIFLSHDCGELANSCGCGYAYACHNSFAVQYGQSPFRQYHTVM